MLIRRYLISAIFGLIYLCSTVHSECFSIMGLSTCTGDDGVDEDHPFSLAWWFVNVKAHMGTINKAVSHLKGTFVGKHMENRAVAEIWKVSDTDIPLRFFQKIIANLQANGEPVEMLLDHTVSYTTLFASFRGHYREIQNFLEDFINTNELEADLAKYGRDYIYYIKKDSFMLQFAPNPLKTPIFQILKQGFDPDV